MNASSVLVEALATFGIIFVGLKLFLDSLQVLFDFVLQRTISSLTDNRFISFAIGCTVAFFVQSSSMTTLSAMGLANAGLMNFAQLISFNLGAYLSTSGIGWIFAAFPLVPSSVLIVAGMALWIPFRGEKLVEAGRVLCGLGVLFLGLRQLKELASQGAFEALFPELASNVFFAVALGAALALFFRSAVIVVGIAMALLASSLFAFQFALALVVGATFGSSLTPLRASFGANTLPKRAALANLIVKTVGTTLFLFFYMEITFWVGGFFLGWSSLFQLALAHTLLNVVNVLLFLPFISYLEKITTWLIPSKEFKEPQRLALLGSMGTLSPMLSIEQGRQEVQKLAAMVQTVLTLTNDVLAEGEGSESFKKIEKYEQITDNIQREVTAFLGEVVRLRLTKSQAQVVHRLMKNCDELEFIADHCLNLVDAVKKNQDLEREKLRDLLEEVIVFYERTFSVIIAGQPVPEDLIRDIDESVVREEPNAFGLAQVEAIQNSVKNLAISQ